MKITPKNFAIYEQLKSRVVERGTRYHSTRGGKIEFLMPPARKTDAILADMVDRNRREEKRQQKKASSQSGRKRRRSPRTQVTIYHTED